MALLYLLLAARQNRLLIQVGIENKKAANRPKDQLDIIELEKITKWAEENR